MKKIKLNKRDIVALVVIAVIVVGSFLYVSYKQIQYYRYAKEMENLYTKNENPVFCIDKIVTYSSANAIDKSKGQTMQNLNICQFTDMAIFIDNLVDIKELEKESDAMGVSTEETNDEASRKIKERTIKELYIDNIKINPATNKGVKTLLYKSPLSFGKFNLNTTNENEEPAAENGEETVQNENTDATNTTDTAATTNTAEADTATTPDNTTETNEVANTADANETENGTEDLLENPEDIDLNNANVEENKEDEDTEFEEQQDRIDFEIISTNVDNDKNDYTKPVFYADCSNPITLSYLNRNIVTGYSVSTQNTQIKFDGSILQSVGVSIEDLACELSFDIHMKNNLDQQFTCSVGLDVPLKSENRSIYEGFMYGMQNKLQDKYKFFKN